MMTTTQRGFALIIAVILTSVVLALGEALLDIAYKQVLLASSAKGSQYAFYNADSAMECALYWDQKQNAFNYNSPLAASSITCNSAGILNYASTISGATRITNFTIPCPGGGTSGQVSIYKQNSGTTDIYSNGYNSCDLSIATLIERGLKTHY